MRALAFIFVLESTVVDSKTKMNAELSFDYQLLFISFRSDSSPQKKPKTIGGLAYLTLERPKTSKKRRATRKVSDIFGQLGAHDGFPFKVSIK